MLRCFRTLFSVGNGFGPFGHISFNLGFFFFFYLFFFILSTHCNSDCQKKLQELEKELWHREACVPEAVAEAKTETQRGKGALLLS